ncbi:DUF2238 domain-containing protein [Candidatus Nitrospira neomarina]
MPITYQLLTIHAVTLILGGHSTYAEVPLNFWMQGLVAWAETLRRS